LKVNTTVFLSVLDLFEMVEIAENLLRGSCRGGEGVDDIVGATNSARRHHDGLSGNMDAVPQLHLKARILLPAPAVGELAADVGPTAAGSA